MNFGTVHARKRTGVGNGPLWRLGVLRSLAVTAWVKWCRPRGAVLRIQPRRRRTGRRDHRDLGAALVWFGAPRGEQEIGDADLTLTGEATGDRFGQAVDAGGDFNGLGWDDLVVGAPGAGGGDGALFVFALDRL